MNSFFILLMILFLLLIVLYIFLGFKKIVKRVIFNKKELNKKEKYIVLFMTIELCIVSINVTNISSVFFLHILILSSIFDLIYFIIKKFSWNKALEISRRYYILPIILSFIIIVYGFFNLRNVVKTNYVIHTNKNLNHDVRVLLIADSHYGHILKSERLHKIKEEMDKENADIVLLVGDIVDEYTTNKQMKEIFEVFGSINNKDGIYYVHGNHDLQIYSSSRNYSFNELHETIRKNSITYLNDDFSLVNDDIVILGREDLSIGREKISRLTDKVNKNRYIISMDHQPKDYIDSDKAGVDMLVSGHTHDGQIFPVNIIIDLFKTSDMCYGHRKVGNMNAFVTSGLVGWGFELRTAGHSEYVVIDIKK